MLPQTELREKLSKMYDVKDSNCVFVFGLKTQVRARRAGGWAESGAAPRAGSQAGAALSKPRQTCQNGWQHVKV